MEEPWKHYIRAPEEVEMLLKQPSNQIQLDFGGKAMETPLPIDII